MQSMATSNAPTPMSAAQEWRLNWTLVLSAMVGLSLGTVPSASLGLFMDPLSNEFGWTRAQISAGMTVFAIVGTPLTPFAGALVDRFGPRSVAVPGLALTGLAFAAFGLMDGSVTHWITLWVVYTLAALLVRSMVWNSAVSSAFTTSRGLALAVLLSGLGIAQGLAPIVTHWLIQGFGWRGAYAGLGIGWGGIALVLAILFFRVRVHPQVEPRSGLQTGAKQILLGGLTLAQAVRNPPVLRIALAIFLQSTMGAAVMIHLVPLQVSLGMTRGGAAAIITLLGLSSIIGKLVTGWLADRSRSSFLPLSSFAMPGVGYLLMLQAHGSAMLVSAAVMCIGYGSGSAIHMTTYLTTKYAGLRNFGKIFGLLSSMMGLGAGIGPLAAGSIYDFTESYSVLLMIGIPAALVAGLSVFGLGPYPDFRTTDTTAGE